MNKSAVILPSGAIATFVVIVPSEISDQVVEKSSDCRKRFVLAHSQRKPLSVSGEIGNQAIVVLKHFTPSTFEP